MFYRLILEKGRGLMREKESAMSRGIKQILCVVSHRFRVLKCKISQWDGLVISTQ